MAQPFWRRCSSCKNEIGFERPYWTCSVSTCNRKGSSFVFCSVSCWDSHVPTLRHREAWAEEQRSPNEAQWQAASQSEPTTAGAPAAARPPQRRVVHTTPAAGRPEAPADDILIVASKLKAYVRARSGMNTSDGVMRELSDRVRALCDAAIRRAREDGRKTVLDRDF
jgi:hypothetical protein